MERALVIISKRTMGANNIFGLLCPKQLEVRLRQNCESFGTIGLAVYRLLNIVSLSIQRIDNYTI
jgi:hypothetical protein